LVLLHLLRFGAEFRAEASPAAPVGLGLAPAPAPAPASHPGPFPLNLVGLHVDHGMRPESADDAAWLRGVHAAWQIPFVQVRLRTPPRTETEARTLRYEALAQGVCDAEARALLTAHHEADQVETILFRILRGTGLRGLAGIPSVRELGGSLGQSLLASSGPSSASARPLLVRPLLNVAPAALDEWATRFALRPRIDPTNRQLRHARNRIRHEVLPTVEAAFPGAREALLALGRRAREHEEQVAAQLATVSPTLVLHNDPARRVSLDLATFQALPETLQGEELRRIVRARALSPTRGALAQALRFVAEGQVGGGVDLGGGVRLTRDFARIVLEFARPAVSERGVASEAEQATASGVLASIPTSGEGGFVRLSPDCFGERWPSGRPVLQWGSGVPGPAPEDKTSSVWTVSFPEGILKFPLQIRTRRPGDRVRMGFEGGGVSPAVRALKKLLSEQRVFRGDRGELPLLVDDEGLVIWVPGVWKTSLSAPMIHSLNWTIGVRDDAEGE